MSIDEESSSRSDNSDIYSIYSLQNLPDDVVVVLFEYLSLGSLYGLCLTCKRLHNLVTKYGWAAYLRSNQRVSYSLSCVETLWTPFERLRYNAIVERNWDSRKFVARPLSSPWRAKLLPVLAISRTRLVVAAGSTLDVYRFACSSNRMDSPVVRFEATYSVGRSDAEPQARHDITGVAFVPDGGDDRTLLAGFADGYVMHVFLPEMGLDRSALPELETLYTSGDIIESLCLSENLSFTLSGSGKGVLRNVLFGATSEIHISGRSWSSHISAVGTPYVAIGTSSATPLAIHSVFESGLSPDPSFFLSSIRAPNRGPSAARESSAVYGITGPPPSFPGHPGQVVVSGWFDGRVRLYDMRVRPSSSYTITARGHAPSTPVLSPILTLSDPWATESIYAVAVGGGTGHTVAAGTARHSVVAFWDVRAPRDGWSVYAPGNDSSPVYALALESARVFGATQSRPFVCDFGEGVHAETYPPLPPPETAAPRGRGRVDGSLKTADGVHFDVTKYLHRKPMAID
ncbi:hypothetical protein M0805_009162 [Coniferiporia weirii]|nr:hypothetical protein M0805_009162 [Coniferiporia weirii]